MEIHDELAAQIQNSTEAVEYIDGVSSIAEEDDEKSTLTSIQEERDLEDGENGETKDEEEVQIDTFRVIGIRRSPGECLVSNCFPRVPRDKGKKRPVTYVPVLNNV